MITKCYQTGVAFALAAMLATSAVAAGSLDRFAGAWQGVLIDEAARGDLKPSDLDLAIVPDGNGFQLTWTSFELSADEELRRKSFTARFAPSKRAGVYAFDDEQDSLIGRLFASPATGNPLRGETLLWARVASNEFVVYGLSLGSQGDFELHRVALVRIGDELAMERTIRTGDKRLTVIEGRLQLAGN